MRVGNLVILLWNHFPKTIGYYQNFKTSVHSLNIFNFLSSLQGQVRNIPLFSRMFIFFSSLQIAKYMVSTRVLFFIWQWLLYFWKFLLIILNTISSNKSQWSGVSCAVMFIELGSQWGDVDWRWEVRQPGTGGCCSEGWHDLDPRRDSSREETGCTGTGSPGLPPVPGPVQQPISRRGYWSTAFPLLLWIQ